MFVQVIRGHVSDAAQVRAQLDKWQSEVAPGAEGWLGSTSGVTDDGEVVALVRFESEEAASQNSDRPEQGTWWQEMARLFIDEPVFHNSTSVEVDTPGDPSQAGFVQVMQGRSSDPDRARELMANDPTDWGVVPARHLGHPVGGARRRRLDDGHLFHLGRGRAGRGAEGTAGRDAGDDEGDGRPHPRAASLLRHPRPLAQRTELTCWSREDGLLRHP